MGTPTLAELIAQRKQQVSRNIKTLKPADGRNRYRVLPSWRGNGDETFWMDYGQHFIKDSSDKVKAVYLCTNKTFGKVCQVCAAIEQGIRASTDDLTLKILEEAKSSGRVLVNVLHLDGPTPNEPQILELPPSVFNGKSIKGVAVGGLIGLFEEWPDMLDLARGNDIIVERSGKGKETVYALQIANSSKPVSPEVMKKIANLDEFVAENPEAERRAITALGQAIGLLPPASEEPARVAAPAARPALASPATQTWTNPGAAESMDMTEFGGGPTTAPPPVASTPPAAPATIADTAPVAPNTVLGASEMSDLDSVLAEIGVNLQK